MFNKIMVIGNLGSEPELRYTPTGKPVCSFRLATNRRWTDAEGESREETEWFTVTCWGKLGETVNQYLAKGRLAFVEGRVTLREWEGQDGQKRSRMEITVTEVKFLDRTGSAPAADDGDVAPEGLPF